MSSTVPCSSYCWGPIHIHPQSESLSQDLLMIGQSITGMPGLISEVVSHQDTEAQPLTERVIDHVCLGFMGLLALGSAPLWVASAGIALAAEKFIENMDVLHGMATKVEQSGRSLSEQEKIIEEFGPLLDISDKVVAIAQQAEQKTKELKKSTQVLDELEVNYKPHADLLERVGDMITRVHMALTKCISQENITGLQEINLETRVTVLKQIAEEERQMKLLAARLNEVIVRVGEKAEKLQQLEVDATVSTQVKGDHITGLQREVESLIMPIQNTGFSHGNAAQIVA